MDSAEILSAFEKKQDQLIQILHAFQNINPQNYITEEAMEEIAAYLNITHSAVYGVVSYYTMFSLVPRGRNIIRLCKSPVCYLNGVKELELAIKEVLGVEPGETTSDGQFTLEYSECLGLCGGAPSMMINDNAFSNFSLSEVKSILSEF